MLCSQLYFAVAKRQTTEQEVEPLFYPCTGSVRKLSRLKKTTCKPYYTFHCPYPPRSCSNGE